MKEFIGTTKKKNQHYAATFALSRSNNHRDYNLKYRSGRYSRTLKPQEAFFFFFCIIVWIPSTSRVRGIFLDYCIPLCTYTVQSSSRKSVFTRNSRHSQTVCSPQSTLMSCLYWLGSSLSTIQCRYTRCIGLCHSTKALKVRSLL